MEVEGAARGEELKNTYTLPPHFLPHREQHIIIPWRQATGTSSLVMPVGRTVAS